MSFLQAILELVHQDPGDRGLARQEVNLLTETAGHYEQACNSLSHPGGVVLLTGFFIPTAEPPGPETDGPPGAIHLARVLTRLGFKVAIAAESYCHDALRAGLEYWGLLEQVPLLVAPLQPADQFTQDFWHLATKAVGEVTHWISIERAGPSHTVDTLREQPQFESQDLEHFLAITKPGKRGRILTMSGHDITEQTSPLHLLFEKSFSQDHGITRIGIGDGGNEIGMGAIPWQVIQQNIQNGGEIACAIPADFLLVAGVSNWGAWALSALLLHQRHIVPGDFFDSDRQQEMLALMVKKGNLVDGRTGEKSATVDGLNWAIHANILRGIQSRWR